MIQRVEPRADRQSWILLIAYSFVSMCVIASSHAMESGNKLNYVKSHAWLDEATSHGMILIAAILIPFWLSRFPLSSDNWKRHVPIYGLCFISFAAIHIVGMVLIRKLLYPSILGMNYNADLLTSKLWIYELRKDFMAYILILGMFLASRQLAQLRLEADMAKQDARVSGRITLKNGGRMIFLQADEIIYAKSAGNYVEVFTDNGMHLIRMTMSALENLLNEAEQHIRVHRSYLVRKTSISELKPNGDGEAVIFVPNKVQIPVSRKYRAALETKL